MRRFRNCCLLLAFVYPLWLASPAHADCTSPANAIVAENCLPGTPQSQWDISGAGDSSIQGFTTDISVNHGQTVSFKISTNSTNYKLNIYRLGYYGGAGARLVTTISPSATLPQNQPACITDTATAMTDCGNWAVSASWPIPATAVSGLYLAVATRQDTGGASHIPFIVRNDSSTSDIVFKTSDTTWQAYNDYAGANLYTGGPGPQSGAYKVSYNRPFHTRVYEFYSWIFNAEYPMIRFLESNGYDISYISSLDADRFGPRFCSISFFCRLGMMSTGLATNAITWKPHGLRAFTWRSSAATKFSGKFAGSPASTGRTPSTAPWFATRKPIPTGSPIRRIRRPGRAPGAIHASVLRQMAAVRKTH